VASIIDPRSGKVVRPDDPDFLETKVRVLEADLRASIAAIVDLQHRVSEIDGRDIGWPGDTYEPLT